MKTANFLLTIVLSGILITINSCETDDTLNKPAIDPPVVGFQYPTSAEVNTGCQFKSISTGEITSYYWTFGSGEGSSSEINPIYVFKTVGQKTITLKVTGPGGTNSISRNLTVYPMAPDCHNYDIRQIMRDENILYLRAIGLQIGRPVIINNYPESVHILLYHPDVWLSGNYGVWNSWTIPINVPNGNILQVNNDYINVGDDWGIRVTFNNGVKSCIKTLHSCCKLENQGSYNVLKVKASDIYEGTYSW